MSKQKKTTKKTIAKKTTAKTTPTPTRRGRRKRVNFTYAELWKENKIQKFKAGNVVRNGKDGDGNIGVIQRPLTEIGLYCVKWHIGTPNKWDYVLGEGHEDTMVLTDEPNPLKYELWEKYPGPSSMEIKNFEEKLRKKKKEKSVQDVDLEISVLEEEYKKKKNIKTEDEVDIIVPNDSLDGDSFDRDLREYENEVLYDKIKKDLNDGE